MSFRSVRTRRVIENSKKKLQKNSKIKKNHYGLISGQKMLEKDEKETKQVLSFRSVPTRRVIENYKKIEKKFKKLKKKTIMAAFQSKTGWKRLRKRENKNYRYVSFQPDA